MMLKFINDTLVFLQKDRKNLPKTHYNRAYITIKSNDAFFNNSYDNK